MLVENTRGFWFTRVQLAYPGFTGLPHLSSKHGAPLLPNPESLTVNHYSFNSSHAVYNYLFSATFRVTNTCLFRMLVCFVFSTNNFI